MVTTRLNTSSIEAAEDVGGTKFRLYPQPPYLDDFEEPETVFVSSPPGSIWEGPQDDRMYTVFPTKKDAHYGMHENEKGEPYLLLPPWQGDIYYPAQPDEEGHFDHIETGTNQFYMAHLFGSTRFTLDVWERYFGRRLDWHFRGDYDRIELSIMPNVDNAFLGWGFLETGGTVEDGTYRPFFLNFDVISSVRANRILSKTPSPLLRPVGRPLSMRKLLTPSVEVPRGPKTSGELAGC